MCDSNEEFDESDIIDNISENSSISENSIISENRSISENNSNNIDLMIKNKCNEENSCRIMKKIINNYESLVSVPTPYLNYFEVFNERNCNCKVFV